MVSVKIAINYFYFINLDLERGGGATTGKDWKLNSHALAQSLDQRNSTSQIQVRML